MAVEQGPDPGWADVEPGPALATLLAGVELPAVPDTRITELLQAGWRQLAHVQAGCWAAMVELGRRAPRELDADERRHWAAGQIAAALHLTWRRADRDYALACQLVERLPLVWQAVAAGRIDAAKAALFADHLAELAPGLRELICRRLLPHAPGWTTGQLAHRLLHDVLALDPDHARRRYRAGRHGRAVWGYLGADGTAVLTARGLAPDEAAGAAHRLERLAAAVRSAGHPATEAQLRADLFVRLLDGRYQGLDQDRIVAAMLADAPGEPETAGAGGETPAPPQAPGGEIRVALSTVLGLDDLPAELAGWGPVAAEQARRLVATQRDAEWRFAVLDDEGHLELGGTLRRRPSDGARTGSPSGGLVQLHVRAGRLAELMSAATDGQLPAAWVPVLVEIARRHQGRERELAALDQAPRSRAARAALRRHVQLRDGTCVAPGCRRPARAADLDHTLARARGGRTVAANLGPLCEAHHLMKHRDGWELTQPAPGRFRWRSPLGQVYRTGGEPLDGHPIFRPGWWRRPRSPDPGPR